MDKIINLSAETYALVKEYSELKNHEEEKYKKYEERLLELLFKSVNLGKYESISAELEEVYPTTLCLTGTFLNVREITLKYLRAYAYSLDLLTLDDAINDCIKKDNQQEKTTKTMNALYQHFQKKIEKMEGK